MLGTPANSQELVAIEEIRANTIVLKGGGLRQVVMVGGMNFALKSEAEQNAISESYQDFLNSIDFPIQILIHSRKINIEHYLGNLETRRTSEKSPLLQNQISEYQEFIRSFVRDNPIMRKIFLVLVPFTPISLPTPKAGGFNLFGKKTVEQEAQNKTADDAEFEKSLAQLKQRVDQVIEGLRTVGLETAVLNDEQLTELFYNFYNPETIEQATAAKTPAKHK